MLKSENKLNIISLEIDGKKIEITEDSTIMQAANSIGIYIPHFCYHKHLSIAANCRMCLVEIEKSFKAIPACSTLVKQDMIVYTSSNKVISAQQSIIEFLLINHPLDCPICDQGGECQLQDLTINYGKSFSRYKEEKRVVFHKDIGPLISMEEMSRCIHCTRCIRFGKEISGDIELGMIGRGEKSEITTFLGKTVNSELSGNMIDICPVGALTSKPFRYTARNWELLQYKSISPHDSVGANIIVQVKDNEVVRILPFTNDLINECWISDKDRFSYKALTDKNRLLFPMIKYNKEWKKVEWDIALEYIIKNIINIREKYGSRSIVALISPHSTIEELYLFKEICRNLEIFNIDFRLRQLDFSENLDGIPWLGTKIVNLEKINSAFIIGSFLSQDHPLLGTRLRKASLNGAKISFLQATNNKSQINSAKCIIKAPSQWLSTLFSIALTISKIKKIKPLKIFKEFNTFSDLQEIAYSLIDSEPSIILLGNNAVQHPEFSKIHAISQWIAENTGSTIGFLTEAINTVGAHAIKVLPKKGWLNAKTAFEEDCKAYILFNIDPEFDLGNPSSAISKLNNAKLVIRFSPFKTEANYINIMLPIAPFTETSGTFINTEGTVQSFGSILNPLGNTLPGWIVLNNIGKIISPKNFYFNTSEQVRNIAIKEKNIYSNLSNSININSLKNTVIKNKNIFERISNIPIYRSDQLVRNSNVLQLTETSKNANKVRLSTYLFNKLGLKNGDKIYIHQENYTTEAIAIHDINLEKKVIQIPAATLISEKLGSLFGELKIEKI